MPKPSSPDSSKFAQLKTKANNLAKEKGPFQLIIAGVAIVATITTLTLVAAYHRAPITADLSPTNPTAPAPKPEDQPSISSTKSPISQPPTKAPAFINLQPTVDAWLKTTKANVGLMIYDLDNNKIAASYQPNRVFNVASIYKLFFVYDGYHQIESGTVNPDAKYVTTSDYRAGTYTYGKCLDLMIRESYNGCADKMYSDRKAYTRVEALIKELNLKNTKGAGLSSTAADLTELLKLYYEHPDLSNENWQKIADSMLNQPPTKVDADTIYDWRQGLPSGFSKQVNVYDKVGWAWNETDQVWTTYADAAIVEFPTQDRHYTVVVLTSGLLDRNASVISNLGTRIEDAVLSNDSTL